MNTFLRIPVNKRSLSMRKNICGVGINDAKYITTTNGHTCPFYRKWSAMIVRCYSPVIHKNRPTYIDCTVSKEWLTFSNFKSWMEKQDWRGMELDKDIVNPDNKVYSAENCMFVTRELNLLLNDRKNARGDYPQGVFFHEKSGKFTAKCGVYGGIKRLGTFTTPEAASKAYNKFKALHIIDVAQSYLENTRLYDGLISHAACLSLK